MAATGPTVLGSARSKITDELDAVLLVAAERSAASEAAVGGGRTARLRPSLCERSGVHALSQIDAPCLFGCGVTGLRNVGREDSASHSARGRDRVSVRFHVFS